MLLHGGRAFTVLFFVPETEANTIGAISMVRDAPLSPTAARKKITSPLKLPPLYCPVLWTGVRVSPGLTHSSAGQGQLESVFLAGCAFILYIEGLVQEEPGKKTGAQQGALGSL